MILSDFSLNRICRSGLLILGLVVCLFRSSSAAELPLPQATAVYGVIATDPLYLWIAQEKGFFKKNGVNIDLTHIPTNQAVQALVGGKVNFVTAGPQVLEANLAGSDTVYIMSPVNTFVFSALRQARDRQHQSFGGQNPWRNQQRHAHRCRRSHAAQTKWAEARRGCEICLLEGNTRAGRRAAARRYRCGVACAAEHAHCAKSRFEGALKRNLVENPIRAACHWHEPLVYQRQS